MLFLYNIVYSLFLFFAKKINTNLTILSCFHIALLVQIGFIIAEPG